MRVMFPLNMTYLLRIKKLGVRGSRLEMGYNERKIGFVLKDQQITLHSDSERTLKCQGPLCAAVFYDVLRQ